MGHNLRLVDVVGAVWISSIIILLAPVAFIVRASCVACIRVSLRIELA